MRFRSFSGAMAALCIAILWIAILGLALWPLSGHALDRTDEIRRAPDVGDRPVQGILQKDALRKRRKAALMRNTGQRVASRRMGQFQRPSVEMLAEYALAESSAYPGNKPPLLNCGRQPLPNPHSEYLAC